MKELYFKTSKNLESIQSIRLVESDVEKAEKLVSFRGTHYSVLDSMPDDATIYGYVEISKKEDKDLKVDLNNIKASIDGMVAVDKKQRGRKIIGYLEVSDTEYVALVEHRVAIIPIFLLLIILGVVSLAFSPSEPVIEEQPKEEVTFKDGDKGTGELDTDEFDFGEQPTFRMVLNCTPTVENNTMNLRLESPAEDNEGLGFVVKVYLLEKVDESTNEVLETYDEESGFIYESPIIYANENIENCPLDKGVDAGMYNARAMYTIYDEDLNEIGQTACKLVIKAN